MSWVDDLSEDDRSRIRKQDLPEWTDPMLATLTDDHFSHPDWIFERKLDGQRLLAFRSEAEVRLMSRNNKPNSKRYPEVVDVLAVASSNDFVIDGEVVTFDGNVTSFSKLQPRIHIDSAEAARQSDVVVFFYVFDVLHLDGYDVTQLPLRRRKSILKRTFEFRDPLRFTPHRNEDGEVFLEEACRKRWEGLIAKRADAAYRHGRSRDWLKFKCVNQQEFVVGGYTDPKGERIGFGALLIGVYEGDNLRYAGKVGTGFDDDTLDRLHDRFTSLKRKTSPFLGGDLPDRDVHWVSPKLVAEVAFTEWTDEGRLRHPRYVGLRTDKEPKEVVREEPRRVSA